MKAILYFDEFINEGMISSFKEENKGVKLNEEQVEFIGKLMKSLNSINFIYLFKNPEDKCYHPEHIKKEHRGSWDIEKGMDKITDKVLFIMPKPTKDNLEYWSDEKYKEKDVEILNDVYSWFEKSFKKFVQGDDDNTKIVIELRELLKKASVIEKQIF